MNVVQVSVGRPQIMVRGQRQVSTAINRRAVAGPVEVTANGLAGDRVSDERVHGGPDKALCVFPIESYAPLGELLGAKLAVPAFGENLTLSGLGERHACLGDRYRIGSAEVEISQPRQPCLKLAMKHSQPLLPHWVNERGMTGWYFRVVAEGVLQAGDLLQLLARPNPDFMVARLNTLIVNRASPESEVRAVLALPQLSASWRAQLQRRLHGEPELPE